MKGTTSQGERRKKNHTSCIRCGRICFHKQKKRCAACGYPNKKIRHFGWGNKIQRRRTTGTGRMRYLKVVQRKFKNGFREFTKAKPAKVEAKKKE